MPYLILSLALQLLCIVHCLRNRNNNVWIIGIIIGSLIGCLAYFIVEIFPDLMGNRRIRAAQGQLADCIDPERNVRAATQALDLADSVANRLAMGDALCQRARHEEALAHYCAAETRTAFDDPAVLMRLADANLELGRTDAALTALDRIPEGGTQSDRDKRQILRARLLEQRGDDREALRLFEEILDRSTGDEVRCRTAAIRLRMGDKIGAATILREIEHRRRHTPKSVIAEHEAMYGWARATLGELGG
ncbi:MAG: hypothetical protein ABL882_02305 [Sphingopyxis sp.]